jgi:hypothetical protein
VFDGVGWGVLCPPPPPPPPSHETKQKIYILHPMIDVIKKSK